MVTRTLDKFLLNPDFHISKVRMVIYATPTSIVAVNNVINKVGYVALPALLCDCYLMESQTARRYSVSVICN